MNTNRSNYQVNTILARDVEMSCDQMQTRLNANCLVMGPSGSGKTRDFLKPNLLQMGSSFVVLDTKGNLKREVGPVLKAHGYEVWDLDFSDNLTGSIGYDPMRFLKYDRGDKPDGFVPNELSALRIASCICPIPPNDREPFWTQAAQRMIAALILLVAEQAPQGCASFVDVVRLYKGMFDSKNSQLCRTAVEIREYEDRHPQSCAVNMWNRALGLGQADRTWACVLGFVENAMQIFTTNDAIEMYERPNQIDFTALAQKHVAMFITISDIDTSLAPLTSTFIMQAFEQLERYADSREEAALPIPVRFFLDDFANLNIPNIELVLSVARSREIWITLLLQSVMQLNAKYGEANAMSIISNCDTQLLLGFCDSSTAEFYRERANKPSSRLLSSGPDETWLFIRTKKAINTVRFNLKDHPLYGELPEAQVSKVA